MPELQALEEEIRLGNRVCDFYLGHEWDSSIEALDLAMAYWLNDDRERKPSTNDIALGLGVLAGEFLRINRSCRWVLVANQFGCDLGMVNDSTGWQFFPRHWIAKRLADENVGQGVISGIIGALDRDGKFGS